MKFIISDLNEETGRCSTTIVAGEEVRVSVNVPIQKALELVELLKSPETTKDVVTKETKDGRKNVYTVYTIPTDTFTERHKEMFIKSSIGLFEKVIGG